MFNRRRHDKPRRVRINSGRHQTSSIVGWGDNSNTAPKRLTGLENQTGVFSDIKDVFE